MILSFADPADSPALLDIYGQYIHTPITFEYDLPSREEFARRIRTISQDYPYLVCREGGRVLGYAYAHRHMERAAYQWNAELSVYLDGGCTGRGLGHRLYGALMEILRLQNVVNVYGCVTLPNPKSEGLHAALGFRLMGVYSNAGYKNGQWHNVGWFEKQIAPCANPPAPFCSIARISRAQLETALEK
jgi:L-amino acid N-acyltransferase YncA